MTPVKKTHEEIEAVEVSAIEKANGGISNVSLLILTSASLMLNVFCIYLLMGYSVSVTNMSDPLGIKRALLEVEYQKVGGRENYDLLNQAQLIQLKQQLPQVKQYIESQGGETATQSPEATPSQNTTLTPEQVKKLQENAAIEGKKDTKITVYEYSDMECPYCIKQYHDTKLKEKLLAQYGNDVNFVFKNNRGVDHAGTEEKAIGALCAQKIGGDLAYISFYNAIMAGTPDGRNVYPVASLPMLADSLKLDKSKWQNCYDKKETLDLFDAQTKEANSFGLGGTPGTLIVNNETGKYETIEGAYPYEAFTAKIDSLMK